MTDIDHTDRGGVPAFLDKRQPAKAKSFVWTFTNLHTFDDVCPHQMGERYIYKRTPYKATAAMTWGNDVHTAFEQRVSGGKVLPLNMQQWESFAAPFDGRECKVELQLGINRQWQPVDYWAKDIWGRGKADLFIMNGETAFFNDWKTGNSKYEDPFELEIGAMLLRAKFPQLRKVVGTYTWLKDNRVSKLYDLSDFNATAKRVLEIVRSIENCIAAGEFPKKRGPLCGWCDVYDCENNSNPERPQ